MLPTARVELRPRPVKTHRLTRRDLLSRTCLSTPDCKKEKNLRKKYLMLPFCFKFRIKIKKNFRQIFLDSNKCCFFRSFVSFLTKYFINRSCSVKVYSQSRAPTFHAYKKPSSSSKIKSTIPQNASIFKKLKETHQG